MSSPDDEAGNLSASSETDREVVRLWRAWRTINEMCRDRGYEMAEDEVTINLEDFRRKYTNNGIPDRSRLSFQSNPSPAMIAKYTPQSSPSNPEPAPTIGTIWVEFSKDNALGVKKMRDFAQHLQEHSFYTGILITQQALTPSAMKVPPVVLPTVIETFVEQDLLVNITHHNLVPRHILLSAEEKKTLLERYRLKENQLPRIQALDPLARYMGLRRGQVVKIIRQSETAGRYATYRWTI